MKKRLLCIITFAFISLFLVACSNSNNTNHSDNSSNIPADTITDDNADNTQEQINTQENLTTEQIISSYINEEYDVISLTIEDDCVKMELDSTVLSYDTYTKYRLLEMYYIIDFLNEYDVDVEIIFYTSGKDAYGNKTSIATMGAFFSAETIDKYNFTSASADYNVYTQFPKTADQFEVNAQLKDYMP